MKLKDLSITKVCLGALLALAPLAQIHANTFTWNGTGTGLDTAGSWTPSGPPGAGDIALFAGASSQPIANGTQLISEIDFSPSAIAYTFTWNAFPLTITGAGVSNGSNQSQVFNINTGSGGALMFNGSSSADVTKSGTISYTPSAAGALLQFNGTSTSSVAPITVTNGGLVNYTAGTNAGTSIITADSTSAIVFSGGNSQSAHITSTGNTTNGVLFSGAAKAGGGITPTQITLNGSKLIFTDTSDANNAVVTANGASIILFDTSTESTGTGPIVTLNDTSNFSLTTNSPATQKVGSLNSNSTLSSVNLFANKSLTTNEGSGVNDVYAGDITGDFTSSFIKDGQTNSSLTLTGPIGGSWEAVCNNGTLIGNTSNLNRFITIKSPGIVLFNQTTNGTFTEVFLHSGTGTDGTLVKEGSATLIIDPTSDSSGFLGTTLVNNGTFQLDGQIGGTLDVFSTLTGTGTANGLLTIETGGTIAPGNSIGTIKAGDYVHNAGAFYQDQVNGSAATATSLILATKTGTVDTATATATLNGGTVNVTSTDGTFLIDTPYTILTANGGVTGQFTNSTTSINPFLVSNLSYDPNNVFMTLNTNFSGFADTSNEEHVAEQLDSIVHPSDDLQEVLQALVTLSPDGLDHALDLLSGQQYTSIFQVSQLSTRRFLRELLVPFRLNALSECQCPRTICCGDIEIWEDVQYGRTYLEGDHKADGYRLRNIDAAIGAQMSFDACWKAGIAAYYENDHIHYKLSGRARVNTIVGALYGIYQDECYYLLSDLLFGYSHFNLKRDIHFADIHRKTRAHPKIYDVTSYTEAGANLIESCYGNLQPFVGLEFGWYRHNHFHEKGAESIDLDVKSKDKFNFDSRLGVRATTTLPCDIILSADVAWQHRYTSNDNTVKLRFEHFGDEFSIRGPKQNRNGVDGTIFIAKNICGNFNVFGEFIGERWDHFSNYTFAIGFDFKM